jgi:multiple sugar transport system substrate-binding protein
MLWHIPRARSRHLRLLLTTAIVLAMMLSACGGDDDDDDGGSDPTATSASGSTGATATSASGASEATATDGSEAASPSTGGGGSDIEGEITFWHMPNGAEPEDAVAAEIAAFNELYPNITVNTEMIDWGSAFTRIQTALQGGEGPCVTQLGSTWVPGFSAMGGLRPYTAEEIEAVGGEAAFVPTSWSTGMLAGSSDVTGMPWLADVRALAYRADLLEQAGLTPEEAFADMDSLLGAMQTIKEETGVDPFVHPGKTDWNVWQNSSIFIWAFGGDILSADGTEAVFNSPEAVDGIAYFTSLYANGLTPSDTLELNTAQAEQRFGDGDAAMFIGGSDSISNARSDNENTGWTNPEAVENLAWAEIPAGPGGQYTFIGGSNLAILDSCDNQDAAVAFVEFMLSTESQVRYGQAVGLMPVTLEGQGDPTFTDDPLYETFLQASQKGKTAPAIAQWGSVEPTFQEQLQFIWEDVAAAGDEPLTDETIQERLDAAAEAVNNLLAE